MSKHHRAALFALAAAAVCSNVACAAAPDAKSSTALAAAPKAAAKTIAQNAAQSEIINRVRLFPRAGFASRMKGGEIQGSNESPTNGFTTLAKLKTAPKDNVWTSIKFNNTKRYRFVRYFAPGGSYANVAELQFFNSSTRISGAPYGTFGSRDNLGNDFNKAFDGDVKTFFDAAAASNQYLGIEIKAANSGEVPDAPVIIGNGLRHYHIGNSLTDGMGDYVREIALAAGYKDDWVDRQTIPGAPLWMNYASDSGFGTNHKVAFDKFAPITDLIMQTFISNGDSDSPEFSLKFYNDARVKSPEIRPWIYGQWVDIGGDDPKVATPFWEERNRALMQVYISHSLNFNAETKGRKSEVIPGGLALNNLKKAVDAGKVPGMSSFFVSNLNDGLHLTEAGRYFIGLVIYASIYDKSPVGLPVVKVNDNAPKLNAAQNKVYQQIAWDTVQSFKKDKGANLLISVPAEIDAREFVQSEMPVRGSRLGNINADSNFNYVVNAPTSGKYDFKVSAVTDKADNKLNVFVNHKAAGSVTINVNGDKPSVDSTTLPITLKAGINTLRLNVALNRAYDLNSIKITPVGVALKNTLPIFDFSVWEDEIKPGETMTKIFRVSDAETPADQLKVTATTEYATILPDSAIKIESGEFKDQWGGVYNRRISVTPPAGKSGETMVTATVTDAGGLSRRQSFKVKVK